MKQILAKPFYTLFSTLMLFVLSFILLPSCNKLVDFLPDDTPSDTKLLPGKWARTNPLVANTLGLKPRKLDPLLVNAWGVAFSQTGTAWVTSNNKGLGTEYDSNGVSVRPAVNIPSPSESTGGRPTGVVFNNSTTDFILSNGQAAKVLFVGTDGIISGWNSLAGSNALVIKNNAATSSYTGVTIASNAGANFLYAANFKAGRIDVYDDNFNLVPDKLFIDLFIPSGYSPFNIQEIGKNLYVTYARPGPDGMYLPGKGNGIVNVFTTNGTFLKRFATNGSLDSPWGITEAPGNLFPGFKSIILISNRGDGRINGYSPDGKFQGYLQDDRGAPIDLGAWTISFAPTTFSSDPTRLYFSSYFVSGSTELGIFGYIFRL